MPGTLIDNRPLNVLLVEDNADDALLLQRHLRRSGFSPSMLRVETADEMQGALAGSALPDVILADYNLPNFSGPEALVLLRSSGFDIPFIMLSGAMSEETAVSSMRAGAQDYVTKQNLSRLAPVLERELREVAARRSRVAAELALQASEARFHRLVDAMPLGLLLSDATGRITYANAAVSNMLGYSAEQMLRGDVTLDSIGGSTQLAIHNLASMAGKQPAEISLERQDGLSIEVLLGTAFLNPDESLEDCQIAAFLADITARKQAEEVLRRTEKLAVAGRLAASIAHEINNPLAAVTNCLYLVQSTELTIDGRTFLEMAQKELDRVAQITVQTLRFHRQSSRAVESDVAELAGTVLALFDSRMRRQNITVRRDFRTRRTLLAFEGELRQVIVNLLGNAIDASPAGGEIVLRTAYSHHPAIGREGITMTIADHGTGMSSQTLEHLFEPFYSTKGITGTGLGLWVSQEIVDRHGGSFQVRSRPATMVQPGGTVFRIFLPLGGVPTPAPKSHRLETV